ncbi:MAG: 50S ribosomal protein L25 [Acidobacteria bacterium]|nr:50S ribosomal protein L25 [Acidobacteriota bacterium]MCZ6833860.1 50S ribosomal protein L25 [Acidobacteriota bacterium]
MSNFVIEVEERTAIGKNESRRLRRSGKIPAVLYGAGKRNFPVSVDPAHVEQILNSEAGANTLLDLKLKGPNTQRKAMIRAFQTDPVKGTVVHADFIRIEMDQKLELHVPVRATGVSPGVKEQGGVVEIVQRTLDVSCLPADIPEMIEVDISTLNIGDQVRLADLKALDNVEFLQPAETVVVTVVIPRVIEEEVPEVEEVEEGAEPEVIGKATKEDEDEPAKSETKDEK